MLESIELSQKSLKTARRHLRSLVGVMAWLVPIGVLLVAAVHAAFFYSTGSGPALSIWQFASVAPHWILLAYFVMFAAMDLPVHVANGATRKDFITGAHLAALVAAAAFAMVIAAGFWAEGRLADSVVLREMVVRYGVVPYDQPLANLVQVMATLPAYAASGLLIGAGYYRFGGLLGTMLLPVTLLPIILIEGLSNGNLPLAALQGGLTLPALVGSGVGVFALAALGNWLMLREMPLRNRPLV